MRKSAVWAGLVVALVALVVLLSRAAAQLNLSACDFLAYWAVGHLNVTGGNPYSPDQVLRLENSLGWTAGRPLMVWYPPWAMALLVPFSLLPYATSRVVWLLLSLVCLLSSSIWLWRMYGGLRQWEWLALVALGASAPAYAALVEGQIVPLILLGIVGFLYFEKRRRPLLAGLCLAPVAAKPQALYLFWIALLLWVLYERRWRVAAGVCLTLAAMSAVAMATNPQVMDEFLRTATDYAPSFWVTTTFGALLRTMLGPDQYWLQFVPSVLGLAWLAPYWFRRRHCWDWRVQMPLLAMMSLLTTPFAWMLDEVVLLVAVTQVATYLLREGKRPSLRLLGLAYLTINAVAIYLAIHDSPRLWYLWMPVVLLSLYLAAFPASQRSAVQATIEDRSTLDTTCDQGSSSAACS